MFSYLVIDIPYYITPVLHNSNMSSVPPVLQKIADLPTHSTRTQYILNDFVQSGKCECYEAGLDLDEIKTPIRTHTPYHHFREWCHTQYHSLHEYAMNRTLAIATAPESSIWRQHITQESPSLEDKNTIFWIWVSRTWRHLPKELKEAFISASLIRGMSIVTLWAEHLWDTCHPQGEDIRSLAILASGANAMVFPFGSTSIVGPLDPNLPIHRCATHRHINLTGWRIPIMFYLSPDGDIRFYAHDQTYNVYFRIWLYKDYGHLLIPFLSTPTPTPAPALSTPAPPSTPTSHPVSPLTPPPTPTPVTPPIHRFSEDFLESIASRHNYRYGPTTLVNIIDELHTEGFIQTKEDEVTFILEYIGRYYD